MSKQEWLLVLRTAKLVRQTLEEYVMKYPINPVNTDPNDLLGFCGIGTRLLYYKLKQLHINSTVIHGAFEDETGYQAGEHFWLEIKGPNGWRIIDVTATQFGIPKKVFVIPSDGQTKYGRYVIFNTGHNAIKVNRSWYEQSFEDHSIKLNKIYKRLKNV